MGKGRSGKKAIARELWLDILCYHQQPFFKYNFNTSCTSQTIRKRYIETSLYSDSLINIFIYTSFIHHRHCHKSYHHIMTATYPDPLQPQLQPPIRYYHHHHPYAVSPTDS